MRIVFTYFILFCFLNTINAQKVIYNQAKVDSLENAVKISKYKSEPTFLLYKQYKGVDANKEKEYLKNAVKFSTSEKNIELQNKSSHILGNLYAEEGDYAAAFEYLDIALATAKKLKNDTLTSEALNDIGYVYDKKSDFETALDYYNKSLEINKRVNFQSGISKNLNNIGMIYYNCGEFSEAINYLKQAALIDSTENKLKDLSIDYNNIGLCYYTNNSLDTALNYYNKSIKIDSITNNYDAIANCINNIGLVHYKKGNLDSALTQFKLAADISKSQGQIKNTALYFNNIAAIYAFKFKDTTSAFNYLEQSLNISQKHNFPDMVSATYRTYYKIYLRNNKYKKALDFFTMHTAIKDSIFNSESQASLQNFKVKYETEKKEKKIELLKKEDEVSNLKIKKQRLTIIFSFIGLALLLILIFYVLRAYKTKKEAYIKINKQKDEITEKNEELNQQNEEILTQRDEIEAQKNVLESQHHQITDSIFYAKNIQSALLPPVEILSEILPNHFIINLPRDIVSGDFYWIREVEGKIVIAVADCTGHGVPGAFMSMLGTAFLNEIVSKDKITTPSLILDNLKAQVVKSLHQTDEDLSSKDGMDIAVCTLDIKNNIIEFAGAYNPLIIIKNNELIEIKGDKMPIGIYKYRKSDFTNHTINIEEEMNIYMFSDGYSDQFGGERNKKMGKKQFYNKLIEINKLAFNKHKQELLDFHETWKQKTEQIDDILVVGINIKPN